MDTKCELKECQLFFKSGENTLLVALDKTEQSVTFLIDDKHFGIPIHDLDKFIDVLVGMVDNAT